MKIRVKLMGMLRSRSPAGGLLELADGATVDEALAALGIPADHVHLCMVNGRHQKDRGSTLSENDELMVMPPVGGG